MLEFGEEITIKTDCEKVLYSNNDGTDIQELKETIFHAVKNTQPFLEARRKANC